jgi:hypothetical protein
MMQRIKTLPVMVGGIFASNSIQGKKNGSQRRQVKTEKATVLSPDTHRDTVKP